MTLDHTKKLLAAEPDESDPRSLLIDTLHSSIELLSIDGNCFAWSSWESQAAAVDELRSILSVVEAGGLPGHAKVSVLFAPTGPIQEVAANSGWGEAFLRVAAHFDIAAKMLWQ